MKITLCTALLATVFFPLLSTGNPLPVLDIDFTVTEGFSTNGIPLNGTQGFNAQGGWQADDTAGTGYATCTNDWNRAKNYASFTLDVGHSVVIETIMRLADSDGLYSDKDSYEIGFADQSLNAGGSTPSIGSTVHTLSDGSYWFGGDDDSNRISIATSENGDWIKFTQTIFRDATASNFVGYISATNITAGTDLGSTPEFWVESTSDGSWGGTMSPSFRTWNIDKGTHIQIDRWTVYTSTNALPEPPSSGGPVTNQASVVADLTRQLYIGGVSTLDRDGIIGWHTDGKKQNANEDNGGYSEAEAELMFDTNDVYVGRSVGGFNWVRSQVPAEDPLRPGYIDVDALTNWCQSNQDGAADSWVWEKGNYKTFVQTDHTSFFPGQPQAGKFNPSNNEAAAEWASVVFSNYWTAPVRPVYYEPLNEPFVHANEMGTTEQGIVDFHEEIIDRLHADIPNLQVGGPCSAWPVFSKWDYDHFRNRVGRFIDQVGDRTDFISWHIYSTLSDDGDFEATSVGANADWQLDLVENYSVSQTGREIPIAITEYGGGLKNHETSNLWKTWSPLRDWHIIRSVMGKTMAFQERPDRVVKAIPFITGKATWYAGYETNAYPYVSFHLVNGEWEETHLTKYFGYWKHAVGDRFPVATSEPDLQAHLFVTNSTAALCLNNISFDETLTVNIAALLEGSASVQSAAVTRLYWDGTEPVLEEKVPTMGWTNITMEAHEAVIVHLELDQAPSRSAQVYRKSHYGDRTMIPYTGSAETFTVNADLNRGPILGAQLKIGVTRSHGESIAPVVAFNGQALTQVTDWPGGYQSARDQFDGTIRMDIPANQIQAINTIDVSFDTSGGFISTVILDIDSELPFDFDIAAEVDPSDLIMSWESSPAFNYAVRKSTDLTGTNWSTIDTLPGTGNIMLYTNSIADPNAFFKVEAVNP